ncbi:unnamed protein product [Ectocarpus sp. 4 AP-2014]
MTSTSQTPMASSAAPLNAPGSAETDREVLLHFFRSTGGESWTHQEGWAQNADDLGSWYGVTSNADGRVVKLELHGERDEFDIPTGNNVTGSIPPELAELGALEVLNLCSNKLSGFIPPELGGLGALKVLNLHSSRLSGAIPSELGQLGAMKKLKLWRNRLTGVIPRELGGLGALEVLDLQNNKLSGVIPRELGGLGALEKLDVNFNQLSGAIPSELGQLGAMKELRLSMNGLTAGVIPRELGGLGALETLHLSSNQLSGVIPSELGHLGALKSLRLARNSLTGAIPRELGRLGALEKLDLAYNKLSGKKDNRIALCGSRACVALGSTLSLDSCSGSATLLAACVVLSLAMFVCLTALWDHTQNVQDIGHDEGTQRMSGGPMPSQLCRLLDVLDDVQQGKFQSLKLENNPWAEPPESIVVKGPKAIRGYYEDLYAEPCRIKRSSIKVVLVGQEGAGKTSLRQSMKANEATPTGEWEEESTVFADVEAMEVEGSSVRVYDCAGQVAYTGLLQMFLTPRAVCVLVCNAGEFGQQLGSKSNDQVGEDCRKLEELRVCDWLRSISRRVPNNDVILVATKCDLAGGNAGKIGLRMEHACRRWLSSWVRSGMQPVRLEPCASLTSCFATGVDEHGESSTGSHVSMGGWACDWRDMADGNPSPSLLHRLVNKPDGRGLRGTQMVLPRSWDIALTVLEALEHGRDPVEVVLCKSPDPDRGDATETTRGDTAVYHGITVEDLSIKWHETVDGLERGGITVINAKNALEGALSIREFDGSLIRHEKFIFLDVIWLARILKPLLNHKDQETFDGLVSLGDTGDARITLDDPSDIASWGRLKSQGVLEPRLAYAIWPNGLSEYVLPTLAFLGLTFPLEDDPAEGLVVLLRLKLDRPGSVGQLIDTFCLEHTPALSASWKIFLGVPPGAIEKVLTRCCGLGGVRTFWRYGVLMHGGLGELGRRGVFAVVLEYSSTDNELAAQIFGDVSTPAPWVALSYVMSAVSLMLLDFPGLRWRGSLACPHHGDTMLLANKATRSGDMFMERSACPKCRPETRGLGAAAIDLVRMVDIRLDRHVIFNEVMARFVVLEGRYSFSHPTGNSKDEDKLIQKIDDVAIAMKGGFNEVKVEMKGGFGDAKAAVDELKGGFVEVQGEVKRGFDDTKADFDDLKNELVVVKNLLDKVAESTQESLMRLKNLLDPNYLYPRLVVVKEVRSNGPSSNAHGVKRWLSRIRGVGKKDMTLHFLCPVDMTTVPCGYGGEGYRFQETRGWVKKISPVLQVAVVTAKVALKATTGLDMGMPDFLKDVKNGLVEDVVDRTLNEDALLRVISGEEDVGEDMQQDTRASYEAVKKFMDKEELSRHKTARGDDGYIDFRDEMTRVNDGRGGMEWVRNKNIQKWLDSHSIAVPTS